MLTFCCNCCRLLSILLPYLPKETSLEITVNHSHEHSSVCVSVCVQLLSHSSLNWAHVNSFLKKNRELKVLLSSLVNCGTPALHFG